jgi:MFS family permease
MTTLTQAVNRATVMTSEERFVIFASSVGNVFEWYDFYLYAVLAPFFAALFFPPGNDTAALLSAFATYAAGFVVRPFGALVFGRIGDLAGRKYTFLVTIIVMGTSTFLVGLLPSYASIGWLAPVLLLCVCCRVSPSAANTAALRSTSPSMRVPASGALRQAGFRPPQRSDSRLPW